ncbi:subtilisin-like protease [Xylariaceae sp. FL1019]|nr:subtilisin-like protease [Xylariaceae sp. FL1019]
MLIFMMRLVIAVLASMTAGVLAIAPILYQDHPNSVANNYLVVMKKGSEMGLVQAHYDSVKSVSSLGDLRGFVRDFQIGDFSGYHVECNDATVEDIRKHDLVHYVTPDKTVSVQSLPVGMGHLTPEMFDTPWGLSRISHRLPNTTGYVDVDDSQLNVLPSKAYVIDTGIRTTHLEFRYGRAVWGTNFVVNSTDDDEAGHGTHVAGTIMGAMVGVDNTTIAVAVKVLNENGTGLVSDIIKGLEWSVSDARNTSSITRSVVNMSLGGPGADQFTNDAIAAAVSAGMTVVVAAGNNNTIACDWSPASSEYAIVVGAIDDHDVRAEYSNYGDCIDIFAPGSNVLSSSHDSDQSYASLSGTSMSSPHVAGLCAYLISREGLDTPQRVRERLIELATKDMVTNANSTANFIAFNGNPGEIEQSVPETVVSV